MDEQELAKLSELVAQRIAPQPRQRAKRKQQQLPDYLTEEEITRLMAVITDPRDRAIFAVVYFRGLRASEVGLIDVRDYQPMVGRLTFRRLKGSRGGEYHLTEEERLALKAWLRKRGPAPGPLFPSRNHRGITRTTLHLLMRRYCVLAGIPSSKAHMHALKHSCATHLSAREADVAAIQDHLGHANIQNTMKYVQISGRRRHEFADKLANEGWGGKRAKLLQFDTTAKKAV